MKAFVKRNSPSRGWKSDIYVVHDAAAPSFILGTIIKMADGKYSVSMANPEGHSVEIFDTLDQAKKYINQ